MLQYIVGFLLLLFSGSHSLSISGSTADVTVFMKVRDTSHSGADLESISRLNGSIAMLKLKELILNANATSEGWNFAVLGRDMVDDERREQYISKIKSFTSIEKVHAIQLQSDSDEAVDQLNTIIRIGKMIGQALGYLPKRPLKPQTPPVLKCDPIVVPDGLDLVVLSFVKYKEYAALKKISEIYMYKVFPALDIRFEYSGSPQSSYWQKASGQVWGDKETWCEYMLSEYVVKLAPLYWKAFADQKSFTGFVIGGPQGLTGSPF